MDKQVVARIAAYLALFGGSGYYLGYNPDSSSPTLHINPADRAEIRYYSVETESGGTNHVAEYWLPASVIKRNKFEDETFEEAQARLLEQGKAELEEHLYSTGQTAH